MTATTREQVSPQHAGVAVMYTKRVKMTGNRFEDNWGSASYGLLLKEIYDSEILGNHFDRNTVGLLADGAVRAVPETSSSQRLGGEGPGSTQEAASAEQLRRKHVRPDHERCTTECVRRQLLG